MLPLRFRAPAMASALRQCQCRLLSTSPSASASSHCLELVKSRDHERYLATLLLDNKDLRRSAFALRNGGKEFFFPCGSYLPKYVLF